MDHQLRHFNLRLNCDEINTLHRFLDLKVRFQDSSTHFNSKMDQNVEEKLNFYFQIS